MGGSARLEAQGPASSPGEAAPAHRRGLAGPVRIIVLVALFVVLAVSALVDGEDPIFGLAVALMWTALVALVWELVARAVTRHRRSRAA